MHAKFYSIKLFCAFIEHSIRFGKKLAPTGPECTKFSSKASLDESNLSSSIVFSPDLLQTTPRPCPSNPHLHALVLCLLGCGDHGELPPTSPGLVRLFLGGEGIVIGLLSYLPFLRSKLFYSSAKIREKKPLVMLQWTELVMTCTVLPSRQYFAETGYCTNQ
jgi:hypothetical protein